MKTEPGTIAQIDNCFIIVENLGAVDNNKVKTLFEEKINNFVNLILYFISNKNSGNCKISITKEDSAKEIFIKNSKIFTSSVERLCLINHLYELDEKILNHKGNKDVLFNYLDLEPSSEIEKKIKLAVSWIGKSLRNNNLIESYLGLCIALEALLNNQGRPIKSQLAEYGAFLTENSLEKRLLRDKEIRYLYKKRCDIVHEGSTKLDDDLFYKLLEILKNTIDKLFYLIEDKKIKKIYDLQKYINYLKSN